MIGDISLVRALGMRGLPVAVVTEDRSAKCTRSRYCRTVVTTPGWMTEPDGAIAALIAWAKWQPAPPVLFYQGDHDLLAVSRARERLARCFRFVLPDQELVEDLVDKRRFAALADRRGLPVPDTMTIPEGSNAADVLQRWHRFPCVLKPAIRSNWYELISSHQKALRIETRTELELLLRRFEADIARFLLQECIEGGEENLLSYHAYVRPGGEIVAEFTGRKIRTSPMRYGLSTYVEITDDDEVRRLGRETIEKLGFSGVLKIDCKRDAGNGRLYMLEINPRFNLWHHPATVAGVGIPEAVYWDCVAPDRVKPMRPARKGVRWMVPISDFKASREYRAAGQLSRARWLFELLTVDVNEGFRIGDPFPVLADLAKLLKRLIFRAAPKAGPTT
ncbi:MAG TPA: ATP-grasp domain-containing protein [Planctomycetota bacterium]|nr:ATP-grasp domain-containing protein [Planctomycetota bacterium]